MLADALGAPVAKSLLGQGGAIRRLPLTTGERYVQTVKAVKPGKLGRGELETEVDAVMANAKRQAVPSELLLWCVEVGRHQMTPRTAAGVMAAQPLRNVDSIPARRNPELQLGLKAHRRVRLLVVCGRPRRERPCPRRRRAPDIHPNVARDHTFRAGQAVPAGGPSQEQPPSTAIEVTGGSCS